MVALKLALLASSAAPALTLMSPAFPDYGELPQVYAETTSEISPPLAWSNAPRQTRTLVLVVDEPKESGAAMVHWILYNIPPTETDLPEGALTCVKEKRHGPQPGLNHWAKEAWAGVDQRPAKLRFRLYALNRFLQFDEAPDWTTILAAMEGHVLDSAEIFAHAE